MQATGGKHVSPPAWPHLEEGLLHPTAALDGQGFPGDQDFLEERAGVVDVVRAHSPSHLLGARSSQCSRQNTNARTQTHGSIETQRTRNVDFM